jgi:hypothetical protein
MSEGNSLHTPSYKMTSRSIPRFKKDDVVRKHGPHGPYVDLHIQNEPYWADWLSIPEWMYSYDYGLGNTSEGSAPESVLRHVPKFSSPNVCNLDLAKVNSPVLRES